MSADVQHLTTGQAPAPVTPSISSASEQKPAVPVAPKKPVPAAGISIPEPKGDGMGRKIMYGAIGILVLLAVIFAAVSLLGDKTPEPTTTPTASASPTPTPARTTKDLSFYFGQLTGTLQVPSETPLPFEDFQNLLRELVPLSGQAANVEALGSTIYPSFLDNADDGTFGNSGAILIFGQTERFSATGEKQTLTTPEPRLIYILEVADATSVNQLMQRWESVSLTTDMSYYFNYNVNDALVTDFMDAVYQQIPVRYQNYPYADKSIDWAIVPASNNINYLVISGSRESMFYAINQLLK